MRLPQNTIDGICDEVSIIIDKCDSELYTKCESGDVENYNFDIEEMREDIYGILENSIRAMLEDIKRRINDGASPEELKEVIWYMKNQY